MEESESVALLATGLSACSSQNLATILVPAHDDHVTYSNEYRAKKIQFNSYSAVMVLGISSRVTVWFFH